MAAGKLASQTLQKFSELEELAQEIMEDKHQVRIYRVTFSKRDQKLGLLEIFSIGVDNIQLGGMSKSSKIKKEKSLAMRDT